MYDRPEVSNATDGLWEEIKKSLGYGPKVLTRRTDVWALWQDPELLLAQTCSLPFRQVLHSKVHYVATPDYAIEGCPPGYYKSVFVALKHQSLHEAAQGIFAFNETLSQSGWAGPMVALENLAIAPKKFLRTGSHLNSARTVSQGDADFAALDAHSWNIIQRYESFAKRLFVIAQTDPVPGLPYICAKQHDPELLFNACKAGLGNLKTSLKGRLGLHGFVRLASSDYISIPNPVTTTDLT